MLNSSRNVFATILKLNFLEIQLGISIYKNAYIPKSRASFYLKSGISHEPGSPKDTQTPCWLRPCLDISIFGRMLEEKILIRTQPIPPCQMFCEFMTNSTAIYEYIISPDDTC